MANLIYWMNTSLDGYVADEAGDFDWSEPSDEVHAFANELERPIGTYLYGRRVYEAMAVWQTLGTAQDEPAVIREFGDIWRAADKVVYSRTLDRVSTPKTRLEREFEPASIRKMKAEAARDISVNGPTLAAHAIRAGLVDEYHVLIYPVVVGAGLPYLPGDVRLGLELVDEHRFANGIVHLHYRDVAQGGAANAEAHLLRNHLA